MAAPVDHRDGSQSDTSSEPEIPEACQAALGSIKEHVFHRPQGNEDWMRLPEVPDGSELMASQIDSPELLHNILSDEWPSRSHYLETHYRLLRREGIEALRYAVNSFKSRRILHDDEDACIYTKVRILGYLMTKMGPLCRISFSTENSKKRILWQQSRRLQPGTLLAVSTKRDKFESICMVATVAQRPYRNGLDHNPPQIDIVWGNVNESVIDPDIELIMVEARAGYFEAVRHTLIGLQMAAKSDSPFFNYILGSNKSDALASFVEAVPSIDLTSCLLPSAPPDMAKWLRSYDPRQTMPDVQGLTSMDETQFHALYRMVTKELCIVQGPPGTGKTYTSVEALKTILANQAKDGLPIIVAAQTNHALDQLLGLCLDAGAHILRIGGRTESERIAEYTIFNTRQKFFNGHEKAYKALEAVRRRTITDLSGLANTVFNDGLLQPDDLLSAGIITKDQFDSLQDEDMEQTSHHLPHGPFSLWLAGECIETAVLRNKYRENYPAGQEPEFDGEDYEYEGDIENVGDEEDDDDHIHGSFISFVYKWSGREPAHLISWHKRAERELEKSDLYLVPKTMRGPVYQLLFARYLQKLKPQFVKRMAEYINRCQELKANKWLKDTVLVKQLSINIVGCTTTGLTKYRGFLAALGAKTMLIEEAAETREANITSALYPSIQQLILIGDHQQLAPFSNVRWLSDSPYYLDMSMFERMVDHLGLPYIMLDKQRRMAPEIRAIVDVFYDGLEDHPVALTRKPIPGMGDKQTWLFTHDWEDATDSNHSKFNTEEATMVVNFFAYIVRNGVDATKITVLTFYKAQRRLILKKLKQTLPPTTDSYHVHTVDSYQGEENDVVLLSLVRSPPPEANYSIGFLDSKNRVTVAISRARRGFYMFGNIVNAMSATKSSNDIWGPIWNVFLQQQRVDPARGLPLQCQPHGKTIWIKNTSAWGDNAGGCDQRCDFIRECGHKCSLPCHVVPHGNMRCSQMCGKTLECGHVCPVWCKDPCICQCDRFKELKRRGERHHVMPDEELLHLDLEDILAMEAPAPPVPVVARTTPNLLSIMQPSPVSRSSPVSLPSPVPQPSSSRALAPALVMPPLQVTVPREAQPREIIRLGPLGPSQLRQIGLPQGKLDGRLKNAGVAYREFARDVAHHDKANIEAHAAARAETGEKEPNIRDIYREVAVVDGRRIERPNRPNSPDEKVIMPDYPVLQAVSVVSGRADDSSELLMDFDAPEENALGLLRDGKPTSNEEGMEIAQKWVKVAGTHEQWSDNIKPAGSHKEISLIDMEEALEPVIVAPVPLRVAVEPKGVLGLRAPTDIASVTTAGPSGSSAAATAYLSCVEGRQYSGVEGWMDDLVSFPSGSDHGREIPDNTRLQGAPVGKQTLHKDAPEEDLLISLD